MFEAFAAWLKVVFPENAPYHYFRGQWIDMPALKQQRVLAIISMGGQSPDVDDRRKTFRVIMLGVEGNRGELVPLGEDIETLANAVLYGPAPCGAANLRAMGEPTGPGFTVENRAFYMLDIEVLF